MDLSIDVDRPRTARLARIAGSCYLLVIAGGLFAEGVVRGSLITPGDATATARAIGEHELLWRWGIAVHLLYLLAAVTVNVLVSGLFRTVDPTLARLALAFGITAVAIEATSVLHLYLPLAIGGIEVDQREALTYLATQLFATGFGFSLLMFAGFCAVIGILILRSRRFPRILGVLMLAAGVAYAVNTLAMILSPALSDRIFPAILLPSLVAELSLALWLLVRSPG